MEQSIKVFDDVGKRRTDAGGVPQRYVLDEQGRRLMLAYYDGTTPVIDDLVKKLQVPRWVVKRWASNMGLARQKEPPWSQAEIEYLETYLHRSSLADIAKKLGRTKVAVKLKAKRLGINKCYQEGYTLHDLELALGVDHKKILRWIEAGWLKGRHRHTERESRDVWLFTDQAIRKFIVAHPNEIDPRRVDWLWIVDVLAGGMHGIGALSLPDTEGEEPIV